ncbi:UDP-glucose/GDP-mannose dehydrogenase family protein [Neobacillus niacini]|uniref:UDP-glucose dehydrogenase family protein n=1 Tax=Neobacillus niacini TaxID=86668 RepID=UPI00052F9536|nr:UDP-glucose/GDP-mannose dehydrogenase family protein [Neobacillus niacini]KGM46392.1 UDP-glucose 6-dehydrogenase [Neobacillus niacini]MEC1525578.1 UDP-glucose/GDP-mannose dehydrogenase family protein [Neobacillus niacini]
MKITVAGAGNVGLVTAVCFAEAGHQVTCLDTQKEKIEMLEKGHTPFFEPGLEPLLEKNLASGQLRFSTNPKQAYRGAEIIFIAVGTPEKKDGSVDLSYIYIASYHIAENIENDVIVCTKSTVPVGTNDIIKQILQHRKPRHLNVDVVSNPEFLREGSAIRDFYLGDRIIIGADNPKAASIMEQLYLPFQIPIVVTDTRSAEMIKYASNAFLATKISFINEIANLCEKVGANIDEVSFGMGMDKRIGLNYLQPGIGYGGSCFPKDTKALVQLAGNVLHPFELLESVIKVNQQQHSLLVRKAKERFGSLKGKKAAVLGLAFKPETDDIREAVSLTIIKELLGEGSFVSAYDPIAIPNAHKLLGNSIEYSTTIREAVKGADFAVIATEWDQIKHLPLDTYTAYMKEPIIFDGRNCYSLKDIQRYPITYVSIGRPTIANVAHTPQH